MKPLRIALTKGRLEKDTVNLLEQIGLDCTQVREKGRRLILPVGNGEIEVVLAKAADVITYVENGVCDLGVVGKDTIMENGSHFYEILDLGFGRCRFALACRKGTDFFGGYKAKTVASKYPNVARLRRARPAARPCRRHRRYRRDRHHLKRKRSGGHGDHRRYLGASHRKHRQP